jgi:branched-subunit amino acid ABC-type transport system permease component
LYFAKKQNPKKKKHPRRTRPRLSGLGSVWGAVLAGFLLGIVESWSVIWLTTGYNAIVGPALMLLMLVLRPQGSSGSGPRAHD